MEVRICVILDLEHVLNVAVVKMIINATGVKIITITNVAMMIINATGVKIITITNVVKIIINATGLEVFTKTNVAWMKQILVIVIEIGEATNPHLTLSHHRTVPNAAVRKNKRMFRLRCYTESFFTSQIYYDLISGCPTSSLSIYTSLNYHCYR